MRPGSFVLALVAIGGLAGCSSQMSSSPSAPPAQSVAAAAPPGASNIARAPLSLGAFPISISAFPISLSAFPISLSAIPICDGRAPKDTGCHTEYRSDIASNPNTALPAAQIPGYHPADLQDAYGVTDAAGSAGNGQTIAIVVAYKQKLLRSDLAVYRQAFGMPECNEDNGCLSFVNQDGTMDSTASPLAAVSTARGTLGKPADGTNPSIDKKLNEWTAEASLDAEMVSAMCPKCHIMVAEANSSAINDLAAAVDAAVKNGATAVSNSYSVREAKDNAAYESHYNHPGVPITAGAGDKGYGVGFPAASPHVIAVGGTSLIRTAAGWSEAVWPATGSGCSEYFSKPSWQHDKGCANRTTNDIAIVADPATGVAGYTVAVGGWNVFGGTSVGAPIVAAMYALSGQAHNVNNAERLYAKASSFAPVTQRANGECSPAYLCTGGLGYDGPSGVGAPTGLAGF